MVLGQLDKGVHYKLTINNASEGGREGEVKTLKRENYARRVG
jgi:hypothetical protein